MSLRATTLGLQGRWRLLALVSAADVVIALTVVVARAYFELEQPINNQAIDMGESMRAIPDLASLTRQSDLVVVGRVTSDGVTVLLQQPVATPANNPPPQTTQPKGAYPPPPPPALQRQGQLTVSQPQTPVTSYQIQIERVGRGTASVSEHITVSQPGGTISVPTVPGGPVLTRNVQVEDDIPMRAGERYVFFLKRANDGTFFVVGGAQGRLSIDGSGHVHPLNPGAPATHSHDGQALDSFLSEVAATHD
jgi:hypothetical protein